MGSPFLVTYLDYPKLINSLICVMLRHGLCSVYLIKAIHKRSSNLCQYASTDLFLDIVQTREKTLSI